MTSDTIETLLTYQDPALNLTAVADRERILEEILDGRRSADMEARPRRPRRARTVRLAAAGTAAAAILAVPILGNGQQAYAGWTAYPAGLSLGEDSMVTRQCQHWAALAITQGPTHPVLSERRGENALALLRGPDNMVIVCTQQLVPGEPKGGSSMTHLAEPTPDGLVSDRGSASSKDTGEPIVRIVAGRVGENVKSVTVHTKEQGDVIATVRNGYFAAWWPGEAFEPAALHPLEFSFTAGLADGSTRDFSRPADPQGE